MNKFTISGVPHGSQQGLAVQKTYSRTKAVFLPDNTVFACFNNTAIRITGKNILKGHQTLLIESREPGGLAVLVDARGTIDVLKTEVKPK